MEEIGRVIIITGLPGSGKDTVLSSIASKSNFTKFPTCTTRKPRTKEIDGIHYHFLNEESFEDWWRKEELLDRVYMSGNQYGLPFKKLQSAIAEGKDVIIITSNPLLLKRIVPEATLIFLISPSHNETIRRMKERKMNDKEIEERVEDDPTLLQIMNFHDLILVNHTNEIEETTNKILSFVEKNYSRPSSLVLEKRKNLSRMEYIFPEFFATPDKNKLFEVNKFLDLNLKQMSINIPTSPEVKIDFDAEKKAKYIFQKTGKFVLVESTGIEFESWNSFPGGLTDLFLSSIDSTNVLKMFSQNNRKMVVKTSFAFFDGTQTHLFSAQISGTISGTIHSNKFSSWSEFFLPDIPIAGKNIFCVLRKKALQKIKNVLF